MSLQPSTRAGGKPPNTKRCTQRTPVPTLSLAPDLKSISATHFARPIHPQAWAQPVHGWGVARAWPGHGGSAATLKTGHFLRIPNLASANTITRPNLSRPSGT
jgi:hypothetical protein